MCVCVIDLSCCLCLYRSGVTIAVCDDFECARAHVCVCARACVYVCMCQTYADIHKGGYVHASLRIHIHTCMHTHSPFSCI